jgi:hypothetical protein
MHEARIAKLHNAHPLHWLVLAVIFSAICLPRSSAQTKAGSAEGPQWWHHAVFYEIYPRAFVPALL